MAKTRNQSSMGPTGQISTERSARLYRMLAQVRERSRTRDELARSVRLDMRGFYRDLKLLRELGVRIKSQGHSYLLAQSFERAISRLPFPDPLLNLHEAIQLAEGPGPARRKLRAKIRKIIGRER